MTEEDREHWDERWTEGGLAALGEQDPSPAFLPFEHLFPTEGLALEIACGRGREAVWLASRGMDYHGVDVSPVAIDLARQLVRLSGLADRCSFEVHDLDLGLPDGPNVDLLLCHLFRDPRLDQAMIDRLVVGGLMAVAALSEVGVGPGPFRVRSGELREAFAALEVLAEGEAEGIAWFLGRRSI